MQFSVEYYESEQEASPVREFLRELKASDPDDYAAVMAGLDKLKERQNHRPPLTKPLDGGLLELRHVGKLNTRILWFYVKGQRIILVARHQEQRAGHPYPRLVDGPKAETRLGKAECP